MIQNRRILKRRHVLRDLLAARDRLEEPPHDLARTRLGQIVGEADVVRPGDRAELLRDPVAQLLHERTGVAGRPLPAEHNKRKHRLPFDLVWLADNGGFRHTRMRDERRLDLHGAETVPGDIEHIVDAPHDPVVPVLVAMSAIAGNVVTLFEFLPVGGDITVVIPP